MVQRADIRYSYAAPGLVSGVSDVGGLIGIANEQTTVSASYWDTDTTGQPISAGGLGEGKTTVRVAIADRLHGDLCRSWGNFWCDLNMDDDAIEDTSVDGPGGSFIRVWDLGGSDRYPALSCTPGGLSAQGR